jgi:hypothetical protein
MLQLLLCFWVLGLVVAVGSLVARGAYRGAHTFVNDIFADVSAVMQPLAKRLGLDLSDERSQGLQFAALILSTLTIVSLLIFAARTVLAVGASSSNMSNRTEVQFVILVGIVAFAIGLYVGRDVYTYVVKGYSAVTQKKIALNLTHRAVCSLFLATAMGLPFFVIAIVNAS